MSRGRPWRPGGNALVLQAGGPTAVINNSLRGVIEESRRLPDRFGTLLGAWHGIEGLLREELLDLSAQPAEEVALLASTPAAGVLGTSRYPITPRQADDWGRLTEVLCGHQVGTVFCIGGNGTMAMAHHLSQVVKGLDLPISVIGVPKTVDNDLGDQELSLIDHAPGYGSAARYWALTVQNALEENRGSCTTDPVLVIQCMGRKIGFLAAAARLADPGRREPLLIYLPESGVGLEQITDDVRDLLTRERRAVVVVSEGLDVGDLGALRDPSGQVRYSSSTTTAAQLVVNHLNRSDVTRHGTARANVPGTDQRTGAIYASTVDLDEAYRLGAEAVRLASAGMHGRMATLHRVAGAQYGVEYGDVGLEEVAAAKRSFPTAWIARSGADVTDEYLEYARPLIGDEWPRVPLADGRQLFCRLDAKWAEAVLPPYVPQAYR